MKLNLLTICAFLFINQPLFASDHIDGVPSLTKHEQVDLTDLYVFQNGQEKRNFSVALNLYPGVGESGHFSSKVQYNIILRPAYLNSPGLNLVETDGAQEVVINCSFTDPSHHSKSHDHAKVLCKIKKDDVVINSVSALVENIKESADGNLKVFTGARSDAFFITREHFDGVTQRKSFLSPIDDNLMESINVLSIALEVNMTELFPKVEGQLLAIAAESFTTEGGNIEVLDRVGRPEITNLSLHSYGKSQKLKMKYNQIEAFGASELYQKDFQSRLISNISAYDELDGIKNWDSKELERMTALLLNDYLVFSTSKECVQLENDFLSIEKSMFLGVTSESCGGRKITDDIMNTLYSLYIGGVNGDMTQFLSGVSRPYQSSSKELSDSFPYLAEPEPDSFWNIKQKLLNHVIKKNQD